MTDKEARNLFDGKVRECIEKELEALYRDNLDRDFAERVINEAIERKNLPVNIESGEDYVEISYDDLVREVKHAFIKMYGPQLDREIAELKRKLNYEK
jgi:hypothetical protein